MALERVLSPVAIGEVRLKNRVVRTAHGTSMGHGDLSDDHSLVNRKRSFVRLASDAGWPELEVDAELLVLSTPRRPGFLPAAIATGHAVARIL